MDKLAVTMVPNVMQCQARMSIVVSCIHAAKKKKGREESQQNDLFSLYMDKVLITLAPASEALSGLLNCLPSLVPRMASKFSARQTGRSC